MIKLSMLLLVSDGLCSVQAKQQRPSCNNFHHTTKRHKGGLGVQERASLWGGDVGKHDGASRLSSGISVRFHLPGFVLTLGSVEGTWLSSQPDTQCMQGS